MLSTVLLIVLGLAVFAAIAAWLNTRTILRDLTEIKRELGIKEVRKPSYFDNDLDKD